MATVRKPSSLAARKMRMAISLRLAASSLRIGFSFFIAGRRDIAKLYIFAQNLDQAETVFFDALNAKSLWSDTRFGCGVAACIYLYRHRKFASSFLLVPGHGIQVVAELQIMGVELSPVAAQRRNLR